MVGLASVVCELRWEEETLAWSEGGTQPVGKKGDACITKSSESEWRASGVEGAECTDKEVSC